MTSSSYPTFCANLHQGSSSRVSAVVFTTDFGNLAAGAVHLQDSNMRSLEDARTSWQELYQYKSLRKLKDAVRLSDGHTSIATRGLRSACWKAFLLFDTLDFDEWQRTLASSRSAYNSLHAHFFRFVENQNLDADTAGLDPLSQDTEV